MPNGADDTDDRGPLTLRRVPARMRTLSGSRFGQSLRARTSLMMATRPTFSRSAPVNARPRSSVMPITPK